MSFTDTAYFYTGSTQTFIVPTTGTYDITAFGAQGGSGNNGLGGLPGNGAEIGGYIDLVAGETLSIIVGGQGHSSNGIPTGGGGGGGGGTFVIETNDGTGIVRNVLLIAGGGGGGGYNSLSAGGGGQITTSGQSGYGTSGGLGGSAGSAGVGSISPSGGGGGGYAGGSGGSFIGSGNNGSSYAVAVGSYAGGSSSSGGIGGFGGGGGGGGSGLIGFGGGGGGGGGYSGGGGGSGGSSTSFGGGGGGSLDNATSHQVEVANASGGDGVVTIELMVCYLRGTRILTIAGEVPVEDLKQGDVLITRFGPFRPVKWIGRQSFNGRFLTADRAPVRIRAGALGENVPNRDLMVSPDHRVLLNERLVATSLLVNGVTIIQEPTTGQIEYLHVDFGVPDCLIADGAWAESYAEQENRDSFHNAAEFAELFPDHQAGYQATCVPSVTDEDLPACRAVALKQIPAEYFSDDADLHLVADGRRINPASAGDRLWTFSVPADARSVRIVSHAASPATMATSLDPRILGVCVNSLTAQAGAARFSLPLDSPALRAGWHHVESEDGYAWRWTGGDAELPFVALSELVRQQDSNEVQVIIAGDCLPRYLRTNLEEAEAPADSIPKLMIA